MGDKGLVHSHSLHGEKAAKRQATMELLFFASIGTPTKPNCKLGKKIGELTRVRENVPLAWSKQPMFRPWYLQMSLLYT